MVTIKAYNFYIIDSNSIKADQQPISTVYGKGSFIYTFTFTNKEQIPLNLTLNVFGTMDDALAGNGSQFVLKPRKIWTVALEIQPKHASLHKLEISLFHDGILFYQTNLQFIVAPQWMSPAFLLPLLISAIFLLSVVLITGTSFLYINNHMAIRNLYWEYHGQLTQLISQLTISNLEVTAAKETEKNNSEDAPPRLLGFPQHLHQPEPLDREALKHQFHSLRDQIVKGDPQNYYKLSKFLTRGEELLNDL
jgi:hypothetical protein